MRESKVSGVGSPLLPITVLPGTSHFDDDFHKMKEVERDDFGNTTFDIEQIAIEEEYEE
jgi:hypothetical protein